MLKAFVEPHLLRLIRNDLKVTSLKEYGEFLALPTDVNTLRNRMDTFARALKIRTK